MIKKNKVGPLYLRKYSTKLLVDATFLVGAFIVIGGAILYSAYSSYLSSVFLWSMFVVATLPWDLMGFIIILRKEYPMDFPFKPVSGKFAVAIGTLIIVANIVIKIVCIREIVLLMTGQSVY